MGNLDTKSGLYPELITQSDGSEWVQISDECGFAGYDPTDDQIAEALFGDRKDLSAADAVRYGRVALQTRQIYSQIAQEGQKELMADLPWLKRNDDIKDAQRVYGKLGIFQGDFYLPLQTRRYDETRGENDGTSN